MPLHTGRHKLAAFEEAVRWRISVLSILMADTLENYMSVLESRQSVGVSLSYPYFTITA